jgi:LmbE family N-acetylglucosaminyl deacetylase
MMTPALTSNHLTPTSTVRKQRLLLVEDDPFMALLLSRWLQSEGNLEVVIAEDGEAGLRMAKTESFDILLSDINLPGVSGLEIATQSRSIAPDRSTILLTAEETVEHALAALRLHVDDLLFKPVTRDALLNTVRNVQSRRMLSRKRSPRVVMAIGAHPDDVEIGCGGILLAHRQSGDRVIVLTLSRGHKGGPGETRADESARAALALDAELMMADLEDTRIGEGPDTIAVISQAIAVHQPSVIYTHTAHDVHQDHRNVHRATLVAARAVKSLFCYQSPSSTIDFHPTCFVDISAQLERKLEVLRMFESQADRRYLAPELLRATAYYWGRFGSASAVEPLEVIRSSV